MVRLPPWAGFVREWSGDGIHFLSGTEGLELDDREIWVVWSMDGVGWADHDRDGGVRVVARKGQSRRVRLADGRAA